MKEYPYPKPKRFKPSPEDQLRIVHKVAKLFSPNKVLLTKTGDKVRGTKKNDN